MGNNARLGMGPSKPEVIERISEPEAITAFEQIGDNRRQWIDTTDVRLAITASETAHVEDYFYQLEKNRVFWFEGDTPVYKDEVEFVDENKFLGVTGGEWVAITVEWQGTPVEQIEYAERRTETGWLFVPRLTQYDSHDAFTASPACAIGRICSTSADEFDRYIDALDLTDDDFNTSTSLQTSEAEQVGIRDFDI